MDQANNEIKEKYLLSLILELIFSIFAIVWFVWPLYSINNNLIPIYYLPSEIFKINFSINYYDIASLKDLFLEIIKAPLFIIYFVPLISLYKFVSFFFRYKIPFLFKSNKIIPILLNIFSSYLIVNLFIFYALRDANNINYFLKLNYQIYIFTFIALIFNFVFVFSFVRTLNRISKSYKEYLSLLHNIKKAGGERKKETIVSIRLKLILSFILIITTVLVILSYVLLNDYKKTILESIENNGSLLANQSATFFKENFKDDININFYLAQQFEKNKKATLPFESLSFYKKQGKEEKYNINSSTDKTKVGKGLTENEISTLMHQNKIHDEKNKTYSFISQISIQDKVIGFSVISYKEDIIYESYFRTLVRMIVIIFLFLYASILVVYLIGSRISLPIIFLRMNVKKLSATLENILSGKEKISAGTLVYDDVTIKSKDEIRSLSLEINDLVGVIKGIIPYVSASTLKHADKDGAKSFKKDMTFLFTDIRNFTNMCEGLSPDNVVEILNRYLDIQTEIILNCNGDIDKFVGDEIMASFDGSNKEANACIASLKIIDAMEKEKHEREKEKLRTVSIGIGINSGPVIVGSVGAKNRMDFTSIGDTVNLAARLEGVNKEYLTKALITEDVYKKVSKQFLCREVDILTVKGKSKPVKIYEVINQKDKATKKQIEFTKFYEDALVKYRKKAWKTAAELFKNNIEKYEDGPSKILYNRIRYFAKNPPPANWDGVFEMTVK